ncbi:MAG TPA: hypothetical protein VLB09_01755, partial [Nitrospiria bacterium]|nr:hypothetical protein [Nitrospiria bacterium]
MLGFILKKDPDQSNKPISSHRFLLFYRVGRVTVGRSGRGGRMMVGLGGRIEVVVVLVERVVVVVELTEMASTVIEMVLLPGSSPIAFPRTRTVLVLEGGIITPENETVTVF